MDVWNLQDGTVQYRARKHADIMYALYKMLGHRLEAGLRTPANNVLKTMRNTINRRKNIFHLGSN